MNTSHRSAKKTVLHVLAGIVGAAILVVTGISALTWRLPFTSPVSRGALAGQPASTDEEEDIAYWTCVMHPSVRQPGPGQCPVCSMDLVPQKRGAGLTLTKRQRDLIPIKTEPVGFHSLHKEIRTVGILEYNERSLAYVSPRISGWIEDVFVDFTGTKVRKDDHLVKIYSRELLPAQQEYLGNLEYLKSASAADPDTRKQAQDDVKEAEDKLLNFGITAQQVEEIKQRGTVQTQLVLYAPIGGTVFEMTAYKGRHVKEGENLYKIADLASLWMIADVYEYEMPWLREGQDVEITSDAHPGETFTGKVSFIYPYLRAETRTIKVLVGVPNSDERLKPGMYVTARLKVSLRDIYVPPPRLPYACPMHPWITSDQPGKCSICGMDLERTVAPSKETDPGPETYWTCPMHPQVRDKGPGNCPICGMKLVENTVKQPTTRVVLTCGMPGHPEFEPGTQPDDGRCPVCEMKLVEKKITAVAAEGARPLFKYTCPEHPDHVATEPGKCPLDGKELVMTDEVLGVPKSAVINTGERAVVYVDKGEGGYVATNVLVGPEGWAVEDGVRIRFFPILKGLQPREIVVTHGNFLIDSQSQLTGAAAGAYGGAIGKEEGGQMPPGHRH
ncbi:efflux RND transporter periplasmic adaptor subunit [bacterium]|nr:efflux RND transporter periplasmic adaptor subunit [bacterium]